MESLKRFFVDNWKSKLVSLFIAAASWHLIQSHLNEAATRSFPVPGTSTSPLAPPSGPALEDSILGPLIPAPIPVPGAGVKG